MQQMQTPEHLDNWDIYDEVPYDGTPMKNIYQNAENYGKPRSHHPTRGHKNKKSKLTCDMLCQELTWNQGD